MSDYEEFLSLDESYKAYSKEVISAWQQSDKANKKAWETLSNSSEAAMMVTKYIAKNLHQVNYSERKGTGKISIHGKIFCLDIMEKMK